MVAPDHFKRRFLRFGFHLGNGCTLLACCQVLRLRSLFKLFLALVGEEVADLVGPLPDGDIGVVCKDGFDDLDDGLVLEYPIVPASAE
jgi:hypothetical protein